jgi:poly-gamma-glutamate synthesis protein (capsule biosynthesis protein)
MLELIAVGDISLAGPEGCDPFECVARYLRTGDIVFGNLETSLCDPGAEAEKEIVLRAGPEMAAYLRQAGFTVLNVANNHALDLGPAGLSQTLAALREHNIRFVGAGSRLSARQHEIVERNGLSVGFLGYYEAGGAYSLYHDFVNCIDRDTILKQLQSLRQECNVAVVSLHWGIEYARYPSPAQIGLAHTLIEGGATMVLGHHPLVVQGIERYKSGLIAYSLGSFQFKPKREEARRSFILRVGIGPRGVERYKVIPVRIDEENRPRLMRSENRREMLRFVEQLSGPIRQGRVTERWWFEQTSGAYLHRNLQAWVVRIRKYGLRHLVQFLGWLASRFTIKCYLGFLRSRVRLHG